MRRLERSVPWPSPPAVLEQSFEDVSNVRLQNSRTAKSDGVMRRESV